MPVVEKVAPEDALERVRDALGDLASDLKLNHGQVDLHCEPADLPEVARRVRDGEGLQCRFFTFLSGIDWSEFGDEESERRRTNLEVFVHLYSPDHVIHVNIHVPLGEDGVCPSITGVFAGANWHERETWEMYGIRFTDHPSLVNLYLPEDFEGNPLLKSFKLPSRIVKPWPGAKDPAEAAGGKK